MAARQAPALLLLVAGVTCGIALALVSVQRHVELLNGIDGSLVVSAPTCAFLSAHDSTARAAPARARASP